MLISIFDLFSIGIGPSSSHTVGPMRAAYQFLLNLKQENLFSKTEFIEVNIYGSLALTGHGHGTHGAILNGLQGETPEDVIPEQVNKTMQQIIQEKKLNLLSEKMISFDYEKDFKVHATETLPYHTNGMSFFAFDANHQPLFSEIYYSIGGGFILNEKDLNKEVTPRATGFVPYPFATAKDLLNFCERDHLSIDQVMLANELTQHTEIEIHERLLKIANIMQSCIEKGCQTTGILPGGLNIPRRASQAYHQLVENKRIGSSKHEDILACLNMFAMAVNEENAAGGRVVTAPTNGAAGIIPAVLAYFKLCHPEKVNDHSIIQYLLTAAAIGILYKKGASISGAEVGCQGEVGVASSMAAAALTAILGGTIYQVENAAEIAMEHHLGMTCDPIGGLVQIPCIERNAMGSIKAVNAMLLALGGDGTHFVSLDKVIAVMKQTGQDMMTIYKETSRGGLAAVNMPEC